MYGIIDAVFLFVRYVMSSFFSMDGPLMRGLSDLATLMFLNLITMVFCIPVVTAGAALTSMNYCIMKMNEGEGHVISLFFAQFKGNLKTATLPWLIMLILGGFIALDFYMLKTNTGVQRGLVIVLYVLTVLWLALFVWILPLGAKFIYSTGAVFRNAFILAIGKLPRTFFMMVITVLVPGVLIMNMKLYPILFVLGLSLPSYLCSFFYYPVIKEMITRMEENKTPEE